MKKKIDRNQISNEDKVKKNLENFKGIIEMDPTNSSNFICLACKSGGLKWISLDGHLKTQTHLRALESFLKQDQINNNMRGRNINLKGDEINLYFKFTQFILENRLPFSIIDSLLNFVKDLTLDFRSDLLKKVQLSATTVQKIATNCIGEELKNHLFSKLKSTPFSLSIDGSSDIYGTSYLAVSAKYLDEKESKTPISRLISIIPMEDSSTGQIIYDKIKNEILYDEDIRKNLMGIVTDEGTNMVGEEKGISSRLLKEFPHIITIKDFSHLYNLIFKGAIEGFPKEIMEIVPKISKHFKKSAQRRAEFFLIQKEMNLEPLGIIKYTKTRWLSFRNSLKRILDLWDPLKNYFNRNKKKDLEVFNSKNQLFLKVLLTLTENINHYNEYFQKDHIFYNQIHNKLKESYVVFAEMVLMIEKENPKFEDFYSINLDSINQEPPKEVMDLSQFQNQFFHKYCKIEENFSNVEAEHLTMLAKSVRNFILLCLQNMRKKLPFNEEIMLNMSVVFFKEFNRDKWEKLGERFKNIIPTADQQNFKYEVRRLAYNFDDIGGPVVISKGNPIEVWTAREEEYPLCSKLAKALLVLPHSTCPVERTFSTMRDFRTPKRSRLTTENLEACLLNYQAFKSEDLALTFSMIQRYPHIWKKARSIEEKEEIKTIEPNNEPIGAELGSQIQNENKELSAFEEFKEMEMDFRKKQLEEPINDQFSSNESSEENQEVRGMEEELLKSKERFKRKSEYHLPWEGKRIKKNEQNKPDNSEGVQKRRSNK